MARTLTIIFLTYYFVGNSQAHTASNDTELFFNMTSHQVDKMSDFVLYITKYLEDYNDKYIGRSELGRYLNYEKYKPNLNEKGIYESRGFKKMAMGMMPLVFHVGATSTWMLITTLLAAKSVAIGIILLVFKIAVSSAKVASFFTVLKSKHNAHHHDWSWSPHLDHHASSHVHPSYSPAWSPTLDTYKNTAEVHFSEHSPSNS